MDAPVLAGLGLTVNVLANLHSLAACLTIWLALLGIGRPLERRLRREPPSSTVPLWTSFVWSGVLGLIASAWFFALLATASFFTPAVVGVITLFAAIWGLGELFCLAERRHFRQRGQVLPELPRPHFLSRRLSPMAAMRVALSSHQRQPIIRSAVAVLAIVSVSLTFVSALAPPLSQVALDGALAAAKELSLSHRLASLPLVTSPEATSFSQLWYAWALVLDGPVAANLLAWTIGLLCAAATANLAREVLESPLVGVAAALALLTPMVQHQQTLPLTDLAAGACATLGITIWWTTLKNTKTGQAEERAHTLAFSYQGGGGGKPHPLGSLALSGALFGSTVAIQPVWASIPLVLTAITAWRVWRKEGHAQTTFSRLILQPMTVACLIVVWSLLVGGLDNTTSKAIASAASIATNLGQGAREIGLLLLSLAAAGLVLMPNQALRPLGLLAIGAPLLGACVAPHTHWWLPGLPLFVLVGAVVLGELRYFSRQPLRLAQAALVVLLIGSLYNPGHWAIDRWHVALGRESREDYLLRHRPEYLAVVLTNQLVPESAQLLIDDPLQTYVQCHTRSPLHPSSLVKPRETESAVSSTVAYQLKQQGVTHLLWAQPEILGVQSVCPALQSENVDIEPLVEFRVTRADDRIWHYRLLQVR